ncbi:MAG TPA: DUF5615 family PIN-like protein [Thermoanaerobaculia bacterium]|nr:DUF5615 family PIN-like protein [Thermoanaerobaculia bacterium]
MAERVRFHLDEHVNPAIAKALRRHGVDVTTTVEAGLLSSRDEEHLDFARVAGRVIMTHDTDFLRFASLTTEHPGIVYCHKTALSVGEIVRGLILVYEVLVPEEMRGRVEFL